MRTGQKYFCCRKPYLLRCCREHNCRGQTKPVKYDSDTVTTAGINFAGTSARQGLLAKGSQRTIQMDK